jgi:hypothetical protein
MATDLDTAFSEMRRDQLFEHCNKPKDIQEEKQFDEYDENRIWFLIEIKDGHIEPHSGLLTPDELQEKIELNKNNRLYSCRIDEG